MTSAVAQIVVPLASSLAGEEERGQVVGTVMSGLLIGILLARTLSGLLAELGGWRLVFLVETAAMLLLAAVLWRSLPEAPPPAAAGTVPPGVPRLTATPPTRCLRRTRR